MTDLDMTEMPAETAEPSTDQAAAVPHKRRPRATAVARASAVDHYARVGAGLRLAEIGRTVAALAEEQAALERFLRS